MQNELNTLIEQADALRRGLQQAKDQASTMSVDVDQLRLITEKIQSCVNRVGNNRMAALSARDTRKVMDELEGAVNQLVESVS